MKNTRKNSGDQPVTLSSHQPMTAPMIKAKTNDRPAEPTMPAVRTASNFADAARRAVSRVEGDAGGG